MPYRFQIHLTEQDYVNYNLFVMFRSPHGRKQYYSTLFVLVAMMALFCLYSLWSADFAPGSFVLCIPYMIAGAVFCLLLKPLMIWLLKLQVRRQKFSGKPGYSPEAVMEFFEDRFTEVTPEQKAEQKYTVIDRVCINGSRYIYIHVNTVMAYILPTSCFLSEEQREEFLHFLGERGTKISIFREK